MGKTKKEHYVPQCYLKNFMIPGTDEKINVFDKSKEQVRLQREWSEKDFSFEERSFMKMILMRR